MMVSTIERTLQDRQLQLTDGFKTGRRIAMRVARISAGACTLAVEAGCEGLTKSQALLERAENRGMELEEDLNQRFAKARTDAAQRAQQVRGRMGDGIDDVSQSLSTGTRTLEQELEKILERFGRSRAHVAEVTIEVQAQAPATEAPAPFADYATVTAKDLITRMPAMSDDALQALRTHELEHKNRVTVLRRIDELLAQPV